MEVFNRKKADEELAETKLEEIAGKISTEYSSETSHDAEDLLEQIMTFRQKNRENCQDQRFIE